MSFLDLAFRCTDLLARASLAGGLLAAAVWAVCRLFPRFPAGLRCALWWLVCLRLLIGLAGLAPIAPIALSLLPAASNADSAPRLQAVGETANLSPTFSSVTSERAERRPAWPLALALAWLAGVFVHLARAGRLLAVARRLLRESTAVDLPGVDALTADLAGEIGLRRVPAVRSSPAVRTPQARLGGRRPLVLLPDPEVRQLSRPELAMTLCHELVHLRRGDLWLGWVPALAERLFFFHPLAALAAREYALAREAACDAEVLRVLGLAPASYGRLLLRLGLAPRAGALAAAGAASSIANLKRRLQMLEQAPQTHRRNRWSARCLVALAALLAFVPFRLVGQAPAPAASPALPALPAPAAPPPAGNGAVEIHHGGSGHSSHAGHGRRHDGEDSYVLLSGEHTSMMNGSTSDIERVRKLRGDSKADFLWFRRGGKEYVVRDPATLQKARDLFKPQMELGQRQAELGAQQAELGSRQAALGSQQAALGSQQAAMGASQAKLAAEEIGREREGKGGNGLSAQQDELGRKQDELGRQQDALGKQQDELGKQQDVLGRQQDGLGRQQDAASQKAEKEFRALMDQMLASGTAQEVH